ncbi:MAG: hypothetical protein AAF577_07300 [Pseudomonadota bacterium]
MITSIRASRLAFLPLALALGACAQTGAIDSAKLNGGAEILSGANANRTLSNDLRVANGVCMQRVSDESGWFIARRTMCIAALDRL